MCIKDTKILCLLHLLVGCYHIHNTPKDYTMKDISYIVILVLVGSYLLAVKAAPVDTGSDKRKETDNIFDTKAAPVNTGPDKGKEEIDDTLDTKVIIFIRV